VNAYIDSSVVLRVVLRADDPLREWRRIEHFVASALLNVECFRILHRLRVIEPLTDEEFASRIEILQETLFRVQLVGITAPVLDRAAGPFSVALKTLDAIHLATALLWREREDAGVMFATHDRTLGLAARTLGFPVIGL
jgi:predicted nucleic acid-binding protein